MITAPANKKKGTASSLPNNQQMMHTYSRFRQLALDRGGQAVDFSDWNKNFCNLSHEE